eukprot:4732091-Amphidinium_carterae.1
MKLTKQPTPGKWTLLKKMLASDHGSRGVCICAVTTQSHEPSTVNLPVNSYVHNSRKICCGRVLSGVGSIG